MARNIPDEDLYKFACSVDGQTILITGGASGIGKAATLEFAKKGANLVIGDIDAKGSEELVDVIRSTGGTAIWQVCNVLEYDDQRSLFEFALEEFGHVDVVIANAGIAESERLVGEEIKVNEQGRPVKPEMKTIEMNLVSVTYTAQLASHYFGKANEGSLKTLVITGSMLSFIGLRTAPMYCSSKHAVLAFMQSLLPEFQASGFRIATVHPWFVDTPLVPGATKDLLLGIPLAPVHRVAGAIVLAATDSAPETNGSAYTIPDEREVFRIPRTELNEDVYALLSDRTRNAGGSMQGVTTFLAFAKYFAGTRVPKLVMCGAVGYSLWALSFKMLSYSRKISP